MTDRLKQFKNDGYLILNGFNSDRECDNLIERAAALAEGFNYGGHPSVFQTEDQTKTSDEYFLNSGERISFFFEKDAFDTKGNLKNDLFHSLNKIGHALHDIDPIFNRFSRSVQKKRRRRNGKCYIK
jgi:phytanoyl-CoA hydroxylase